MTQANFYYEQMAGAPASVVSAPGSIVSILDACLVNGFNSQALTAANVTESGGTATVSLAGHNFKNRQMVALAGLDQAAYNGSFRITVVDANTFTFQVSGSPASPATSAGGATAMTPSAGWTIAYTAPNKRVYRAPVGNQFCLRIDDTGAQGQMSALVVGYESMTDVDTGINQFPAIANLGADQASRWLRPMAVGNAPAQLGWYVVADAKRFFMGTPGYSGGQYRFNCGFGDFTSFGNADAFNTFIGGECSHGNGANWIYGNGFPWVAANYIQQGGSGSYFTAELAFARRFDQVTVGGNGAFCGPFGSQNAIINGAPYTGAPAGTISPITGAIELGLVDLWDVDPVTTFRWRRGRIPLLQAMSQPDFMHNDLAVYTDIAQFGDILITQCAQYNPNFGMIFPLCDWDTL